MTQGILVIFNDVAAGREAEFDAWFQGEHLVERLAVPGFLFGRRHQAISGSAGYFNFYLVESPNVLTSKPYLEPVKLVAGFVFDVESGELDDVVRWERPD